MTDLVNIEDLKRWSRYERTAQIEKLLRTHGVQYWRGKNGEPITTLEAINNALLGEKESIEFE